jgi:hypothetical protein
VTVNGKGVPLVNTDLTKTELVNTDLTKTDQDPERGREEDFAVEVISCEIVSEDAPTRSVSSKGNAESSPSCQKDPNEDFFTLATSSAAIVPASTTVRPVNPLERQLSRKGIALEDWHRFRGDYGDYLLAVTDYGIGSARDLQYAWGDLVRSGWVLDDEFWRGLALEINWGMELYSKTQKKIPGIPGGPKFFESRRWEVAIAREEVERKLRSVGLEAHVEKPKEIRRSEAAERMFSAANRVVDRILSAGQNNLEECHDF